MIKECNVILNNEAVTVVNFDGVKIQMPSIKRKAETIFVNYENGFYSECEKPKVKIAKKNVKKSVEKPSLEVKKDESAEE